MHVDSSVELEVMEKENTSPEEIETTMLSDKEFRVERLVGIRLQKGKLECLVKWYGYSEEENTWEPLSNFLNAKPLIHQFEAELLRELHKSSDGKKKTRNAATSIEGDMAELSERCKHLCLCKSGSNAMKVTVDESENNSEKKKELLACCDSEIEILGLFPNDRGSLTLGLRIKGKTEDNDICYFDKNEVKMLWPHLYMSFLETRIIFREE